MLVTCYYNQHFDVNGAESDGYGGAAGVEHDIVVTLSKASSGIASWKNRPVLLLRGIRGTASNSYSNVVVHSERTR